MIIFFFFFFSDLAKLADAYLDRRVAVYIRELQAALLVQLQ